jgi:hypothetical protein
MNDRIILLISANFISLYHIFKIIKIKTEGYENRKEQNGFPDIRFILR